MRLFGLKKTTDADNTQDLVENVSIEVKVSEPDAEDIPTLESRISKAFPSRRGLYPHEILMLEYASSYKISGNEFQKFWKWDYSVLDPQNILDSLYKKGFICCGDVDSSLKKLVVSDLKKILARKGEKISGKKDDLIKRIISTYSIEELENIIRDRYYALTPVGIEELQENEYIPYLHRHRYMSVWDMNIALHSGNLAHQPYRDIIWGEFNKQSHEHFLNFDFGLYRNTRLNMHDFLFEEEKYKTAFDVLCEVISFDLSGLGNGNKPETISLFSKQMQYEMKMTNLFMAENKSEVTVPSGIIQYFSRLYTKLNMDTEEFIRYTYEQFEDIQIHDRIFTGSECANIILSEIGLESRKIINSRSIAEQRVKEKLKFNQ